MTKSARHFEDFAPHTLLKHATYRAYIERWARILLRHPPRIRLRIVDACAGTGSDESGNPGSPIIAADEADRAAEQMSRERGETVQIEVIAIEKTPKRYKELAQRMGRYNGRHRALCGTLEQYISEIEGDFARVPTLFFIDPFGLEPLKADVIRRCLAGPKNEVFLLFADQAALRHYGVIRAVGGHEDEKQPTLFDSVVEEFPPSNSRMDEQAIDNAERAEQIMDAVYGGLDWRSEIAKVEPGQRRQVFVNLYCKLLKMYGAARVLPLPVIHQQHKYHLVYVTKSPYGYRVMKETVESRWKKEIVGARASELMRLGTSWSSKRLLEAVVQQFRGWEVPWSKKESNAVSIKRFVLEDTPAMPHQLEKLNADLKPYRISSREWRYRFPAD